MPSNYKTVINFRDGIQVDTDDLISNNGLVGIGSTIPRQQLDVRGNVIVDENTELNNLKVTGVTTFFNDVNVATGSSVGIGTTVPEEAFQVGVGTEGATISLGGTVRAQKFIGDGSQLTGIPASVWVNPGVGNTIYSIKNVGIGTTLTRGNANFGVGYEIYMDAESGIGTFEGLSAKNITVEGNANQGNITAKVGTYDTVTASKTIESPSFIGTITNAVRSVVAAGLTDNPDIGVGYIAGVGGTFTGITSFTTLQISGGVVGSNGIITATTFSGTATTASNAAIAYGIGGDPDIQVDKLTVNGIAPSIIRGAGVSTIGQNLIVGNYLGVGATSAATGQAAGFIGTVRVHDGDLILGGSISIGGSLVGTVDLGGTQNINVLNVGAGLSVAGITTLTGDITGGGNFNITGNMTAAEVDSIDSIIAGGGITCAGYVKGGAGAAFTGGGLVVGGGATFGQEIRFSSYGVIGTTGTVIGGGLTMTGNIEGADNISAGGSVTADKYITGVAIEGGNARFVGVTTIVTAKIDTAEINGNLNVSGIGTVQTGVIKFDGVSGIASAGSFYSPAGISTLANLRVTDGTETRIFAKYIGVNTVAPRITEGFEGYNDQTEIYLHGETKGIGIGSTSGDRPDNTALYVGYGRNSNGTISQNQTIIEGTVGIGTTTTANSIGEERLEIYKHILLYGNHTGVGGTVGTGNSTSIRIGINTSAPECALDMKYAQEPLLLPYGWTPDGGIAGNPSTLNCEGGDQGGSLWYDWQKKKIMTKGPNNQAIGIATEFIPGAAPYEERGFFGQIPLNDNERENDTDIVPSLSPPSAGWTTSNMVYHAGHKQMQVFDGTKWDSLVGSATSGCSLIVNGSNVIINVAGVGSVSLSLT